MSRTGNIIKALAATAVLSVLSAANGHAQQSASKAARFVSLKASEVNLRKGPGTDYPIAWVFRRAGLPVKILREFEAWREVTDIDGTTGWVARTLLSNRRTAQIIGKPSAPGAAKPQEPLMSRPRDRAKAVALVEAGVIADVRACDGSWCQVSVGDFKGYIRQQKLWGVGKGEVLD